METLRKDIDDGVFFFFSVNGHNFIMFDIEIEKNNQDQWPEE